MTIIFEKALKKLKLVLYLDKSEIKSCASTPYLQQIKRKPKRKGGMSLSMVNEPLCFVNNEAKH